MQLIRKMVIVMIEIVGEVGRPATEEEIEEFLNREVEKDDKENL